MLFRSVVVVGLREATALLVEGNNLSLLGNRSMRLFEAGKEPVEFQPGEEINFLLKD